MISNECKDSNKPTVSILLPVYEPTIKWLRKAIESVLNQTYKDFEIVMIDDGTSDPVLPRLDDSITNRDEIRTFRQSNQGFSGATNRAFKESRGQYVAPIAQDDWWEPTKIERQVKKLRSSCDIVFTKAREVNEKGETVGEIGQFPDRNRVNELFNGCYPIYESVIVDKKVLLTDWFVDEDFVVASDWDLWFRVFGRAEVGYIDERLLTKRHHDQKATIVNYDDAVVEGEKLLEKYMTQYELPQKRRRKIFRNFYESKGKTLFTYGYESEAIELWSSTPLIQKTDIVNLLHDANYSKGRYLQRQAQFSSAIKYLFTSLRYRCHHKPAGAIILTPYFVIKSAVQRRVKRFR